ncbi:hypothetical protein JM83_0448 [Gillisia sp. Hel_I_86]|nr:hypothetical protein JM83_0448 [Gillisia sp. Hel_I_86]
MYRLNIYSSVSSKSRLQNSSITYFLLNILSRRKTYYLNNHIAVKMKFILFLQTLQLLLTLTETTNGKLKTHFLIELTKVIKPLLNHA